MLQQYIIISNFCFISQRARKLDKFGGKMTKFEDIGVDLNKVKVQLPSEWPNLLLIETLYYYMRNFCNLIGLEQWYFSLI